MSTLSCISQTEICICFGLVLLTSALYCSSPTYVILDFSFRCLFFSCRFAVHFIFACICLPLKLNKCFTLGLIPHVKGFFVSSVLVSLWFKYDNFTGFQYKNSRNSVSAPSGDQPEFSQGGVSSGLTKNSLIKELLKKCCHECCSLRQANLVFYKWAKDSLFKICSKTDV